MESIKNFGQQLSNCNGDKCLSNLPTVNANENQIQNLLGIVFGVIAAVAVIVIILAAIGFATADGNPDDVSKAKKTIIYALVGLAIAISAEAIIYTILGKL